MSAQDCGCLDWMGRAWRRVVRLFGIRIHRPPTPPPLPPPLYFYTPPPMRPRSAFGGVEQGARPSLPVKPELKRMRFQPPTPETMLQIKKALDELPMALSFSGRELQKGLSISNPDFGSPEPGTSCDQVE